MLCSRLNRAQANRLYLEILRAEDAQAIRKLCEQDLFFLLTQACRRPDINRDWLYERCREVEAQPDGMLDLWAREHYKDLDCETPMLTTKGWKRHGDLLPGDVVFSPNGGTTKVVAVSQKFTDSACREVSFRGGASLVAGAGHLWGVKVWSSKRKKGEKRVGWVHEVSRTDDLLSRSYKKPKIPLPIFSGVKRKLPVDPYVLGAWLGDGDSLSGRVCGQDEGVFEEIQRRGYEISDTHCPNRAPFKTCTVYGLSQKLRALGLIGNKHIPESYLTAGEADRLALLRGLMDTDGSQSKGRNSHATFSNTNINLAEGVLTLACSLGFKARISPARATGSYHVVFQTTKSDTFSPFALERKSSARADRKRHEASENWYVQGVKKVDTRPTNCIQVDAKDGMYLAGRQLIPTHNSTVITFGKSIQDILVDPNVTIGIFSHTRPVAKGFLSQIKLEFERNDFLKKLFPDILWSEPAKQSPKWSLDSGILVKRSQNPKEMTVEAWGLVDGQPTSKHFSRLIYDDVVTLESVTTPEQINKTTDAWAMSLNLGAQGGKRRHIGTRYHFNDTYREIIARGAATPRIHKATDNGTLEGKPVLLSKDALLGKRREMGPYVFSSQMFQDPVADKAMGFQESWVRYYDVLRNNSDWNYYVLVDPAGEKKRTSDYTVIAVVGLAPDNNYYLVDAIRDRLNLTQRTRKLFDFVRKWRPLKIGYEKYGIQADIEHIRYVQEQENYRFEIVALGGAMAKEDRIRRLVPIFEQGRMYLPHNILYRNQEGKVEDFVAEFLKNEYLAFPVAVHDDMLDCISRCVDPGLGAEFPKPQSDPRGATMAQNTNRVETDYDVLA